MATIQVNGHEVLCQSQQLGGSHYHHDASTSNYILIRFKNVLRDDQLLQLQALNVRLLQYVAHNTYTCRYEPSDLAPIRSLSFVEFANVYHNDLVVESHSHTQLQNLPMDLSGASNGVSSDEVSHVEESGDVYWIQVHDSTRKEEVVSAITQLEGIDIGTIRDQGYGFLEARLTPAQVRSTTQIDNVGRIERHYPSKLASHEARKILYKFAPEYASEARLTLDADLLDLDGTGETIIVVDAGLDKGQGQPIISHFQNTNIVGWKTYTTGRDGSESTITGDPSGHGTLMVSCISACKNSKEFGEVRGTAPGAALIVKRIFYKDGKPVDFDGEPVGSGGEPVGSGGESVGSGNKADDSGAKFTRVDQMYSDFLDGKMSVTPLPRITNTSSGVSPDDKADGQLSYDGRAWAVDLLVWFENDWLFVQSAGNDGDMKVLKAQIGSYASGKNIITVGSCMNGHKIKQYKIDAGIHSVYNAEGTLRSPREMAPKSSKGPSKEGRVKPDICAPGLVVYGARSTYSANLESARVSKPGVEPPVYDHERYGKSLDPEWWWTSGTSPAAAHVAGMCAVIRQAYLKYVSVYPSAAMVKALLVNGAISFSWAAEYWDIFEESPYRVQPLTTDHAGWGRACLRTTLQSVKNIRVYDSFEFKPSFMPGKDLDSKTPTDLDGERSRLFQRALIAGETVTPVKNILVGTAGSTFTATLVWTDFAGYGTALASELYLQVEYKDMNKNVKGTWWGEGHPPPKPKSEDPDVPIRNNVQKIMLKKVPKGVLSISVYAKSTHRDEETQREVRQHFAICYDLYLGK